MLRQRSWCDARRGFWRRVGALVQMTNGQRAIGRLAMRREGMFWNAYYALPDTMDRAILLGSIAINLVENNVERKDTFMLIMRDAVTEIVKQTSGKDLVWPDEPQDAPPHERAGHS